MGINTLFRRSLLGKGPVCVGSEEVTCASKHWGYCIMLMSSRNTERHGTVYTTYSMGDDGQQGGRDTKARRESKAKAVHLWEVGWGDYCSLVTNQGHPLPCT